MFLATALVVVYFDQLLATKTHFSTVFFFFGLKRRKKNFNHFSFAQHPKAGKNKQHWLQMAKVKGSKEKYF